MAGNSFRSKRGRNVIIHALRGIARDPKVNPQLRLDAITKLERIEGYDKPQAAQIEQFGPELLSNAELIELSELEDETGKTKHSQSNAA